MSILWPLQSPNSSQETKNTMWHIVRFVEHDVTLLEKEKQQKGMKTRKKKRWVREWKWWIGVMVDRQTNASRSIHKAVHSLLRWIRWPNNSKWLWWLHNASSLLYLLPNLLYSTHRLSFHPFHQLSLLKTNFPLYSTFFYQVLDRGKWKDKKYIMGWEKGGSCHEQCTEWGI